MLVEKARCAGCAACANICPTGAITMQPDNTGFLYPIINEQTCTQCGACDKACPALKPVKADAAVQPLACLVQYTGDAIRRESTAGGAFTAIAEDIIRRGGVVFGAAFDDSFTVRHTWTDTVEELSQFRNSKYVQSEIGDTFRKVKAFLREGRAVCFSGTPCQIHGLKRYLGKPYAGLIAVDFVCHSVPSPLIFSKYLQWLKHKVPGMQKLVFRDKKYGYSYSTMAAYDGHGNCLYRRGSKSDPWFRAFLHGLCDRPTCYQCEYQQWPRISDITIWDCFNIRDLLPAYDDGGGTTTVIGWSEAGRAVLEEIAAGHRVHELDAQLFVDKINREKHNIRELDRQKFYADAAVMDGDAFIRKYFPDSVKVTGKRLIRVAAYRLGMYGLLKRLKAALKRR